MGCYINPPQNKKKEFIEKEATQIAMTKEALTVHLTDTTVPVVYIDNGPFDALAVAYNLGEIEEFTQPQDPRTKAAYVIKREKLVEAIGISARDIETVNGKKVA